MMFHTVSITVNSDSPSIVKSDENQYFNFKKIKLYCISKLIYGCIS